jgi:hypothetical protein
LEASKAGGIKPPKEVQAGVDLRKAVSSLAARDQNPRKKSWTPYREGEKNRHPTSNQEQDLRYLPKGYRNPPFETLWNEIKSRLEKRSLTPETVGTPRQTIDHMHELEEVCFPSLSAWVGQQELGRWMSACEDKQDYPP